MLCLCSWWLLLFMDHVEGEHLPPPHEVEVRVHPAARLVVVLASLVYVRVCLLFVTDYVIMYVVVYLCC